MTKCNFTVPSSKSMYQWLGGIAVASLTTFAGTSADASCLGLSPPAPKSLNICKQLAQDLVVPAIHKCGHCGFFTPECCISGSCLIFPECLVLSAAGYVIDAGDVYCNVQEINASTFISDVSLGVYSDFATLASGNVNSAFYQFGGYYVDVLECKSSTLPSALKSVLKSIAGLSNAPSAIYQTADIDRIRIHNRSSDGASVFLRSGFAGVTLDSLVILTDNRYKALKDWTYSWLDVAWGRTPQAANDALVVLIHELVHVRQYREAGRESFLNKYLADVLVDGYSNAAYETQADSVDEWAQSATALEHNRWMSTLRSAFAPIR